MITDLTLTDKQRRDLERGVERLYSELGISTTGLEVLSVAHYDGVRLYRVFYVYEVKRADRWRDINTSDFFRFNLNDWGIDSVEFDK